MIKKEGIYMNRLLTLVEGKEARVANTSGTGVWEDDSIEHR